MAELGHPVLGPQSIWKLTQSEIRVYAEGMSYQREQKEEEQQEAGGASEPKSQSHDKRADDAFERVDSKVRESWDNDGYE